MRARILLLLEVLECKVVRLVPNLIDVCSDKFIGGPVVVNLQLSREVVASLAQACAAGLLTIGSLHGGLAARARHLRLGSGTLVARGPCILHSVGMNGVRQSRSILTLLRQFGARVAALLNWRCLPAAASLAHLTAVADGTQRLNWELLSGRLAAARSLLLARRHDSCICYR